MQPGVDGGRDIKTFSSTSRLVVSLAKRWTIFISPEMRRHLLHIRWYIQWATEAGIVPIPIRIKITCAFAASRYCGGGGGFCKENTLLVVIPIIHWFITIHLHDTAGGRCASSEASNWEDAKSVARACRLVGKLLEKCCSILLWWCDIRATSSSWADGCNATTTTDRII